MIISKYKAVVEQPKSKWLQTIAFSHTINLTILLCLMIWEKGNSSTNTK